MTYSSHKYHQGRYIPRNPHKYIGDVTNIIYRSSWEKKLLIWLDTNPACLAFGSEETVIPYMSPLDNKMHRYFVDVIAAFRKRDGGVRKVLIEVKPYAQTQKPKQPKRKTPRYINEVTTYIVNQAKWSAATEWCEHNGYEFHLITENELFPRKKS